VATLSLINVFDIPLLVEMWYADDTSADAQLQDVNIWSNKFLSVGRSYYCFLEPIKCVMVVSSVYITKYADELFDSNCGTVTTTSQKSYGDHSGSFNYVMGCLN
jgi:hypothetical protein